MAKSRDRAAATQHATERQQTTRISNSTHNFRVTRAAYFTYFVIQQRALHRSAVRAIELARSSSSSRQYVLLACTDIRNVPFHCQSWRTQKSYKLFIYGHTL